MKDQRGAKVMSLSAIPMPRSEEKVLKTWHGTRDSIGRSSPGEGQGLLEDTAKQ